MGGVALKEDAEASRELACTKQKPVVYGGGVEFLRAVSCDYLECPFLGSGSLGELRMERRQTWNSLLRVPHWCWYRDFR